MDNVWTGRALRPKAKWKNGTEPKPELRELPGHRDVDDTPPGKRPMQDDLPQWWRDLNNFRGPPDLKFYRRAYPTLPEVPKTSPSKLRFQFRMPVAAGDMAEALRDHA